MTTWSRLAAGTTLVLDVGHDGGVHGLVWSQGLLISGGADGQILIRREDGGLVQPALQLPGRAGVLALAAAPSGRLLAGTQHGAFLVDPGAGRVTAMVGPRGGVRAVTWTGEGWAAGDDEGVLWTSAEDGAPTALATLGTQVHTVGLLALDRPHLLVRDAVRRFQAIPLAGGAPRWTRADFESDQASVVAIGARIAIGGDQGPIRLLDPGTGATVAEHASPAPITAGCWTDDGLVTGHRDLLLRRWAPDGRCEHSWKSGHRSWIRRIVVAGGGAIVTGGDDGALRAGDREIAAALRSPVITVAPSPDGKRLATATSGAVALWDLATGARLEERRIASVVAMTFLGEDLVVAALAGGLARYRPGADTPSASGPPLSGVRGLAADGGRLVAATDGGVVEIDPDTLAPRGPAAALAGAATVRLDGPWFAWEHGGVAWRAAMLPGMALVLVRGDELLAAAPARARLALWDGVMRPLA